MCKGLQNGKMTMNKVELVIAAAAGVLVGIGAQRLINHRYHKTVEAEVNYALEDVRSYKAKSSKLLDHYKQTNTDLAALAARTAKLLELHDDAHPGAAAHDPSWVSLRVAELVRRMERQGWQFDADSEDMSDDGYFSVISPEFEKDSDV